MNAHAVWSHPAVLEQILQRRHDGRSALTLRVASLGEPRRFIRLEQMLRALPGVQRVAINPPAARVRVVWDAKSTPLVQLLQTFEAAGCAAQPLPHDTVDDTGTAELHAALKRLLVAGMCAMQVMSYALVLYLGVVDFVDFSTRNLFRWLCLLTSVPLLLYAAAPFFNAAVDELRQRRVGINVPVALALAVVSAASTFNTLRGQGEIYFDSVSMLVFLLLLARYVELRARHRNGALGDAVIDATPLLATRISDDGTVETVPAMALLPGDLVHVCEAETVPADGCLESTSVQVDEALLSGESRPRWRLRGERLIAGSMVLDGPAQLRVEHSGHATTAARLGDLARRARLARGNRHAEDRSIRSFVLGVLVLTTLTAIGWLLVDPPRAFDAAVAVLVVACPCAFALTGPATLSRALALLARRGVLVADAGAISTLARVDMVVFDKTGTLTAAQFADNAATPLRDIDRPHVWMLAGALARESSHPLARALAQAASRQGALPHAAEVTVVNGAGIRGTVDGMSLRLGRAGFAGVGQPSEESIGALWLADAQGAIARFALTEQPRPDALPTLDALRRDGLVPVMASGDEAARVQAMAQQLAIVQWHARQTPEDKLHGLNRLQRDGHVILAVGDGSNDAAVLAGADVSAALASGTALAQSQADLLLLNGRLDGLLQARTIAVRVARIVAQNRRWSLAYNLCAVPFAALGFVPPWLAAIGMSLSSLLVVLNALRVGRHAAPSVSHDGQPA